MDGMKLVRADSFTMEKRYTLESKCDKKYHIILKELCILRYLSSKSTSINQHFSSRTTRFYTTLHK